MARLKHSPSGDTIFLKAFHRFGRLAFSVDTLLNYPEITRIHAVVEWSGNEWVLRDLSRNGVWINQQRIPPREAVSITAGDIIVFSELNPEPFEVISDDKPFDLLIPDDPAGHDAIRLRNYHFLPNASSPETIIYFDSEQYRWCAENIHLRVLQPLNDGEIITIGDSTWRMFKASVDSEHTLDLHSQETASLEYIFSLSLDEELAELKVKNQHTTLDLDVRSHHYLTVLLARYRLQDMQEAFEEDVQGWVSMKQLSKDLGMSEQHVNIQIHRARKQFVECIEDKMAAQMLIERKRGKVRFGGKHFTILKGSNMESSMPMSA
ncbi:FHA domain-containing protein [Aestuariibacter sp. AA17]|uniref:FHA domain-containing protein n=1 Tax=Fluctibacter corallii TaxID=2984329 RepID=A0ABT3ACF8_9ALTE|nr:FHA domain-containing protein [Aestuariibacter sp. AA17]MCV2886338.1 FHA domain-containing protein [Aestuariibacter sp. AA17]